MNVLILGAGGREHALAWKIKQSASLHNLFVAPGNAGTAAIAKNIPIGVNDFRAIKDVVLGENIQLLVVGPEDPLVNGVHDFFLQDAALAHIPVIGPQKAAAALEGSKEFAKRFMLRHNIPTAKYESFTKNTLEEGHAFLETMQPPYVLKADGLAAGKGVVILRTLQEAKQELTAMLRDAKFGAASGTVVIEEFLDGIELSVFVLTDGEHYKVLPTAKDYKRIGEGDTGLNTGGMGAISPVPFAGAQFMEKTEEQVVKPTIQGLKKDGLPYKGFIFIGLIKVKDAPKVIEYNVRLGDPETEVVLPRIENDLLEVFQAVASVKLNEIKLSVSEKSAATVMAVSGGYPGSYEKGKVVHGLNEVRASHVFQAGTTSNKDGEVVTNGGRVLAVTSFGADFKEALAHSYRELGKISFEGMHYRKDLGFDL
ncbi:phosphoribosylamine--glycine ligase [Maribacter sp. 2307ULW6-5]|uniref:phosphoribosylamine--glycine ligase n=1 Tax=Maribacter sp. 2307ULW6-5 TaxID=3386275 RepID=UPI0039BC6E18